MKWYSYKNQWIDISKCYNIHFYEERCISFATDSVGVSDMIEYITKEERDAEFEKIKSLMGCEGEK